MGDLDAAFWVDTIWKGATVLAVGFYFPVIRALDRLAQQLGKIEAEHNSQNRRIAELEAALRHTPNHDHLEGLRMRFNDELGQVYEAIKQTSTKLAELSGEFKGVRSIVSDLNNYLRGKL